MPSTKTRPSGSLARLAAGLGLAALLVAGCSGEPAGPPAATARAPEGPPPVPVKLARVVERPVEEHVSFVATVEASVATTVGAEVSGQVVEVPVREGDRVVAGQTVLARLDTEPRRIQLREAVAAVRRAREELDMRRRGSRQEEIAQRAAEVAGQRAILARAERDFERAQELFRRGLIARAEQDRLESEYLAAKHRSRQLEEALRMAEAGPREEEVRQAEAALAEAEARADRIRADLARMTVRAPVSGFVVKKHVEAGAWLQPGSAVADLVVLDPVFVTGPVGEREIRRVRPGQKALVAVDAHPGRTFEGAVSAIVPSADPASRTFPVKVTVQNGDGVLKGGMFARVTVRTGGGRNGLFVPRDALVRRPRETLLFVAEGDSVRGVPVEVGAEAEALVEVRGDRLAAGQHVVTLGNELLQPGSKIAPTP